MHLHVCVESYDIPVWSPKVEHAVVEQVHDDHAEVKDMQVATINPDPVQPHKNEFWTSTNPAQCLFCEPILMLSRSTSADQNFAMHVTTF